jgi:hypothetical protein
MFRFSSTASVTLVEVGWLAPCNAKPVRARRFSFETGSEPSRFFRSETPRTIAQPTETWLLDRYAQPRLFFNDFHVRWTNLRGPANITDAIKLSVRIGPSIVLRRNGDSGCGGWYS